MRTPEEYAAGHWPGATHAPGGQVVQATDEFVGVRNARIVLVDGPDGVRAYWRKKNLETIDGFPTGTLPDD